MNTAHQTGLPRVLRRWCALLFSLALALSLAACNRSLPLAPTEPDLPESAGSPATPPEPTPPSPVAPRIDSQPQHQTIESGSSASLSVDASGSAPLAFQWYVGTSGDTAAPAANGSASSFTTPTLTSTTTYWVRVSNGAGAANSSTVTVTVTAPPPPPPPTAPPPSGSSSFEDQVLALVNQHRAAGATCGGTVYPPVPALALNPHLAQAARAHSQDMAANNYFSHNSQDGRTFDQRIWQAGYGGGFPLGENIAAGQTSPQSVMNGWMQSTGHCQNIMKSGFRAIGVGYASSPSSTYRHYWTQSFGGG